MIHLKQPPPPPTHTHTHHHHHHHHHQQGLALLTPFWCWKCHVIKDLIGVFTIDLINRALGFVVIYFNVVMLSLLVDLCHVFVHHHYDLVSIWKLSFQVWVFHYKDKLVVRPYYLYNGNPKLVRQHNTATRPLYVCSVFDITHNTHNWPLMGELHDGVIKWTHFPRYWPFVRGIHRLRVNSPHKGQWRGALLFSAPE